MVSRRSAFALFGALALTTTQSVAQAPALNANQQQAREIYKELVEHNTSVMTAGTTAAANAMAKRFRDAGIPEADIFLGGVRPDKHNVVIRYRGKGGPNGPKPLLLLAHLDVVEALKSDWSPDLDPFKFIERDGYYYGRGSGDDKAMASIFVANVFRLKKEGYVPDRDIIIALTADEEGGNANGVDWLVKNHKELIDAAYVINEGGGGSLRDGKPFINLVQATEKVVANFKMTAKNRGGHSSVPRPDNAIYQLSAGLVKIGNYSFPVAFNPVTSAFFTKTAEIETPEMGKAMKALVKNPRDAAANAVVSKDPRYNSMLRTTCVATMLTGGHATNALPQTAEANVNCRMEPNAKATDVRLELIKALGDTGIEVSEVANRAPAAPTPLMAEVLGPVESISKAMFGKDVPVIPTMSTGATDSRFFRVLGIPSFGVSGLFGDPNDNRAHGRDERVRIQSYYDAQEFLYRLTKALSSGKSVM